VPLVDVRARFIAPVRFGDVIDHTSQIAKFRRSSFEVAHRIFVGDTLAAEGSETRVWAVRHPGERLGSKPVPPEIVARFRQDKSGFLLQLAQLGLQRLDPGAHVVARARPRHLRVAELPLQGREQVQRVAAAVGEGSACVQFVHSALQE